MIVSVFGHDKSGQGMPTHQNHRTSSFFTPQKLGIFRSIWLSWPLFGVLLMFSIVVFDWPGPLKGNTWTVWGGCYVVSRLLYAFCVRNLASRVGGLHVETKMAWSWCRVTAPVFFSFFGRIIQLL